MEQNLLQTIFDKIKQYDTIILFRHIRPDGDAKGAALGLRDILRLSFPEKTVLSIHDDHTEYLEFMGQEDAQVADEVYRSALGIVVDCGTAERIQNQKYALCKELVKIDHHLEVDPYGDYRWVEPRRSSVCEMVALFYSTFKSELKIDSAAATKVYTGMVTDSGRFQFDTVSGDTLRYAAVLLDQGIDTDLLFARLNLRDFEELKFKSFVYDHMGITEHGAAYIYISRETQEKFGLSSEAASSSVTLLDSIKGSLCWMAFIENMDDDHIRVRLRSRFMAINTLAEQYRGGGHAKASGATLYAKEEMNGFLAKADAMIKEYKETHEDWL